MTSQASEATTSGASREIDVRVRLFAQAREAAGASERILRVPAASTVREAVELLGRACPALAPHLERCSFAVNESYARGDEVLGAGDELAVIPPIGGG